MQSDWDWSEIEKVVYINLAQRKDREEALLNNLRAIQIPQDKIVRFNAIKEQQGALGCCKSHLAVLKFAQQFGWRNVLILEDDMLFDVTPENAKHVSEFLHKLQQYAWDVAMLSGLYSIINKIDLPLHKLTFAQCSNSYIVNQHYYATLIATFEENIREYQLAEKRIPLDEKWLPLQQRDNWMAIYPCAGIQADGYSDIKHCNVKLESTFRLSKSILAKYGSD